MAAGIEEKAKALVETLLPLQEKTEDDTFPCPRCGHYRMNTVAVRNALSRYVKVYICSECGMEEALRDMAGLPPIPISEWGMVLGMSSECEDDEEEGIQ